MPLNETDKAWIRQEIQNSAKRSISKTIRDWVPFAGIIAGLIFVMTQWGDYKEFRGNTNTSITGFGLRFDASDRRFTSIEARLTTIEAKLDKFLVREFPGKTFDEINALDPRHFPSALPS